jgi:hypothetical protein
MSCCRLRLAAPLLTLCPLLAAPLLTLCPLPAAQVFFLDAIEHVSRIARVLRQPRGNALLVGVGGSGKQSLTRFACFMAECQCFQVELSRGYGMVEFREDIKKLYKVAGIQARPLLAHRLLKFSTKDCMMIECPPQSSRTCALLSPRSLPEPRMAYGDG